MSDTPPVPDELLAPEAQKIARRYRVSHTDALAALRDAFGRHPDLARRIAERAEDEDVTRWRDFRDVVRRCRRKIYYGLRRYYDDPQRAEALAAELERLCAAGAGREDVRPIVERLLASHVSTRERLPHYGEFYDRLFALSGVPRAILDVGCGMHPLSYPFQDAGSETELYLALDRDGTATRSVRGFSMLLPPGRLQAAERSVESATEAALATGEAFDLALLLKIVPVIGRLNQHALAELLRCPARQMLVTGNAESMAKRRRVDRRERRTMDRFVEESGRRVVAEFAVGGEFGFLIE